MRGRVLGTLALALLLAGCLVPRERYTPTVATPEPGNGASWAVESYVSGLEQPVFVTHAGDGSGRLFVVEQAGRVRVVADGRILETPFADIRSKVGSGGERGLLGLAFHPAYADNGAVVFSYTDRSGDSVIERYHVSAADPGRVDPASGQVLLRVDQPASNHNGGLVAFGPDGFLYVGLGDGGGAGDQYGNAQDLTTPLGKILRLDVGPGGSYAVPEDNPFVGRDDARPEVWAYGLRNPWRFSFDRATGDLFIADVGQNRWEEINHQAGGAAGGQNYGWNRYEATHDFDTGTEAPGAVAPVAEYARSGGHCAVTGGYVYRGGQVPALEGRYILGDYCSGRLWTLARSDGAWRLREELDTDLSITSFGEDEAGEVYLVHHGGSLYRFVAD